MGSYKLSQKQVEMLFLLSVILLVGLWGILTLNKGAPTPETWCLTWANMVLDGKLPYRDFELVYFPTYTYLNVGIVAVFGNSLFALRTIGVIVLIITTVITYYIFRLLFKPQIAAIATLAATFIVQFENSRLNFDYHMLSNLFAYLVLFLVLRTIIYFFKEKKINVDLNLFLAGLCCGIGFTIRQTTSPLIFIFIIVFLLLIRFYVKRYAEGRKFGLKNIVFFPLGFLAPILVLFSILALNGLLSACLEMVFASGAKGNYYEMMTGWIFEWIFKDLRFGAIIMVIMLLSIFFCIRYLSQPAIGGGKDNEPAGPGTYQGPDPDPPAGTDKNNDTISPFYLVFLTIIAAAMFIVCTIASVSQSDAIGIFILIKGLLVLVFTLNFALGLSLLYVMIQRIRRKQQVSTEHIACLFVSGFIFSYGVGGGLSGTISLTYCALMFGLIAGLVIDRSSTISFEPKKNGNGTHNGLLKRTAKFFTAGRIMTVAVLLIIVGGVAEKAAMPFSWWMTSEPYTSAKYTTDIDHFRGIKLTYSEKEMYEGFVGWADMYLGDGDELYCYPYNPVFYTLVDKIPSVRAPIPWMDVSTEKTILADLEYLKNNLPKMIVFMDHGEIYLEVHEQLYNEGKGSAHRLLHEWLWDCMDNGDYDILATYNAHDVPTYVMLRVV